MDPCNIYTIDAVSKTSISVPAPVAGTTPIFVTFVIDESGSMATEALVGSESTGQCNLGVVCTAVAASMSVMPETTYAGVVMFSDRATLLSPIVQMTPMNKGGIKTALMQRHPTSSTNLEAGVKMAIDMEREKFAVHSNKAKYIIIVLTDGQPDTARASTGENYGAFFKNYSSQFGFTPEIITCGFGYNVNVDLLVDISKIMNGHFSFIPTPDMVATNFVNMMAQIISQESAPVIDAMVDSYRIDFINKCTDLCRLANMGDGDGALAIIRSMSSRIRDSLTTMPDGFSKEVLIGILKDIEGEVALALSDLKKNYNVWGRGYIPSLARAHELKFCANFKDHGLQNYAGPLFKTIQTSAASIFKSELTDAISRMASTPRSAYYAPVSAAAISGLYNPSGGCFDGNCLVTMADGTTKPAMDIVRGDMILSFSGVAAEVYEIVRTLVSSTAQAVVFKSGLRITAWHPIFMNGHWIFPDNAPEHKKQMSGTTAMCGLSLVYSFAVRGQNNAHGMQVDDVFVATLGHGVSNDPVLSHPFYGTNKVLDAISNMYNTAFEKYQPEPIIGSGIWYWSYDENGAPNGILENP
jgi:hypothetical protein